MLFKEAAPCDVSTAIKRSSIGKCQPVSVSVMRLEIYPLIDHIWVPYHSGTIYQNKTCFFCRCALDDVLLPNLIYNNELNLAYQEAQVFKYPDEAYIHFRCQIRLCTKMDGGCEGMAVSSYQKAQADMHFQKLREKHSQLTEILKQIIAKLLPKLKNWYFISRFFKSEFFKPKVDAIKDTVRLKEISHLSARFEIYSERRTGKKLIQCVEHNRALILLDYSHMKIIRIYDIFLRSPKTNVSLCGWVASKLQCIIGVKSDTFSPRSVMEVNQGCQEESNFLARNGDVLWQKPPSSSSSDRILMWLVQKYWCSTGTRNSIKSKSCNNLRTAATKATVWVSEILKKHSRVFILQLAGINSFKAFKLMFSFQFYTLKMAEVTKSLLFHNAATFHNVNICMTVI